MNTKLIGTIAAAALAVMPGCIVQEIHDELKNTNHQLETRLAMLDVTNERLTEISASLERTNESLSGVKAELAKTNETLSGVKGELATTNGTMSSVQKRLDVLDSINTSLASLDGSLKTVKNLIEKIPFVGSSKEEEKPAPAPAPDKPAADKPVEPSGDKH